MFVVKIKEFERVKTAWRDFIVYFIKQKKMIKEFERVKTAWRDFIVHLIN